jgi:hypothetical protein
MGTNELRKRENWQEKGGAKASKAENGFYELFKEYFKGTFYQIRSKPNEFKNVYSTVKLPENIIKDIYNPQEKWIHGFIPDYAIDNLKTKKTIYVEVKRQDGWVEGKERKAGRGNAHERSNKLFTPGLQSLLRQKGNIDDGKLPFWVVFQGDIARDPKRVREIHFWYGDYEDHFFLWMDNTKNNKIIDHFNQKIKQLID